MQQKILSKKVLIAIIICVVCIGAGSLIFLETKNPPQQKIEAQIENETFLLAEGYTGARIPIRLSIPSISVDAVVNQVGLAKDGRMEVPPGPDEIGWFNQGPVPGEAGSAVVSGHFGWKNDIPAVFDNLHLMKIGDKIYVEDENGKQNVFVVRAVKTFDKDDDASSVFSSSDGGAYLNLITCSGEWNAEEKTRSRRLVVFSERE